MQLQTYIKSQFLAATVVARKFAFPFFFAEVVPKLSPSAARPPTLWHVHVRCSTALGNHPGNPATRTVYWQK